MLGHLFVALAAASSVHATIFNVTVGASSQLMYNPQYINGGPGDAINFIFFQKNHTATQSSFAQPCTRMEGGIDSGFQPVAADATEFPTLLVPINDTTTPIWFYCGQTVGEHCGHGMVFAINPPQTGNKTFQAFLANALATLNETTTTTAAATTSAWTPPPPQPWATATATVTNGTAVYATTYTSYLGSVPPSPLPVPVDHQIEVGPGGEFIYSPPNITAQPGDTITFKFNAKNHTVTQSSFSQPCQHLQNATTGVVGFTSGFQPVSANDTDPPTFRITINDTAPIWGYCGQTGHCAAGMVFAINAVESGPNNFENFVKLAQLTGSNTTNTTSAGIPGSTSGSSPQENSAALPLPFSSVSSLALFLLLAFAL